MPKECPKCAANELYGDIWSQMDQLWMQFESEVQQFTLYTVYWCKRCDYHEEKQFDPEIIHDNGIVGRCTV